MNCIDVLVKEFDSEGWESGYESYIQFWLDKRKIVEIDVYTIDSCYTYDMDLGYKFSYHMPLLGDGYAGEICANGYSIPTDKPCI